MSPSTAAARSRLLRERVASSRARFLEAQIGSERSAVILRRRARHSGALLGLTDNYIKLEIAGPDDLLGRRVRIRIEARSSAVGLTGRVLT